MTVESATDFIRAGAVAVGVGSCLIGDAAPEGITKRARQIVDAVVAGRTGAGR